MVATIFVNPLQFGQGEDLGALGIVGDPGLGKRGELSVAVERDHAAVLVEAKLERAAHAVVDRDLAAVAKPEIWKHDLEEVVALAQTHRRAGEDVASLLAQADRGALDAVLKQPAQAAPAVGGGERMELGTIDGIVPGFTEGADALGERSSQGVEGGVDLVQEMAHRLGITRREGSVNPSPVAARTRSVVSPKPWKQEPVEVDDARVGS